MSLTAATRENPIEWRVWLGSFAILPFLPLVAALAIVSLTARIWWRDWRSLCADRYLRLLAIWLGLMGISCFASPSPSDALLGACNFWPLVFVFGAMTRVLTDRQRLRELAWAIVLPIVGLFAIGLGELYAGWSLPQTGGFFDFPLVAGGTPPGRMSSLFLHANALSNYAAIVLALLFGLACDTRDVESHGVRRYGILAIAAIATAATLFLTSSRNAWGVSLLVTITFALYRHWWPIVAAIGGAIATVSTAAFAPDALAAPFRTIVPYAIWGRLSDRMYPDRPIASLRITQWNYALDLIAERPFFGWGLRSFSPLYEAHSGFFFGHPHNLYLMFAAETGAIAMLVILAAVGGILTRTAIGLWRQRFAPETQPLVFAYATAFLATSAYHLLDVTLFNLQINLVGWALLAGLVGIRREARS